MGQTFSLYQAIINESFPPKPTWSPSSIPDLTSKVIIITGGNSGIGYETAKALLPKNAKVYLACRNEDYAKDAIRRLKEETGREALFLKLDLSDLKGIREAAEEFKSKESELHVLFNNAGIVAPPLDQLTADGYDLQFGTNCLGHFYLTKLLLPLLISAARSDPIFKARVVNTSSFAYMTSLVDLETVRDGPKRRERTSYQLYCQSKFVNAVFAREFARRYADQGIVSTVLNPGNLITNAQRYIPAYQKRIIDALFYPAHLGALTQLYAGTTPEGAELNGKYLKPWARVGEIRKEAADPKLGEQIWAWFEEQVKHLD